MKRILTILLCLAMLLTASACGKKDKNETGDALLHDIPTATADKEDEDLQDDDTATEDDIEDDEPMSDDDSDRTEETDRSEIKSNLRDARELIENGDYDDASMIISGLKTYKLTAEEKRELNELQQKMLQVSD